ncbi:hypothetical protein B0H10DRAFT_1959533 [Mycena sp. CBHHK59/15]|nr:hypothetical protein B0H10DRAFT_1959533 [Mycena sp. CBHHK59/15]
MARSVFLVPLMGHGVRLLRPAARASSSPAFTSCAASTGVRTHRGSPCGPPRSAGCGRPRGSTPKRTLFDLYYLSFFIGLGEIDETNVFGTFTPKEPRRRGMEPIETTLGSDTDAIEKTKICPGFL